MYITYTCNLFLPILQADDTNLRCKAKNIKNKIDLINSDLTALDNWWSEN